MTHRSRNPKLKVVRRTKLLLRGPLSYQSVAHSVQVPWRSGPCQLHRNVLHSQRPVPVPIPFLLAFGLNSLCPCYFGSQKWRERFGTVPASVPTGLAYAPSAPNLVQGRLSQLSYMASSSPAQPRAFSTSFLPTSSILRQAPV